MTPERLQNIGSAAAGIVHDINNHLHLIVNHLSMSDVEAAMEAVRRCSALTSNLLTYSKGAPAPLQPLDPCRFVRDFVSELFLPAGVHLLLELPESPAPIAANPEALSRILFNLVSNALAAMNNDGILRISVSAGTIEVGDSGPGIPAEAAARIFEPFFTTKGNDGTGLGLAIVRDLMRQHGGSVRLISEPGRGAAFRLRFRLN